MTGFSKHTLRQNGEHFGSVLFKQRRIFCPISGLPIFFTNKLSSRTFWKQEDAWSNKSEKPDPEAEDKIFFPTSQTALLYLQQMALLGFPPKSYAAAGFEPTLVSGDAPDPDLCRTLHRSADWAKAPRHGKR